MSRRLGAAYHGIRAVYAKIRHRRVEAFQVCRLAGNRHIAQPLGHGNILGEGQRSLAQIPLICAPSLVS